MSLRFGLPVVPPNLKASVLQIKRDDGAPQAGHLKPWWCDKRSPMAYAKNIHTNMLHPFLCKMPLVQSYLPHSSSQRFQRYMSSAMTSGLGRVLSSLCRETPKVKIAISWPGPQQWSEVRAVQAFKMRLIMMPPTNNRISIEAFMNTKTVPEIWNICILYIYIYIIS